MRTRLRVLGALVTTSVVAVAVPLLSGSQAEAVGFTGGNLVVYRVGTAGGTLSNAAVPVFLDEFVGTAPSSSPVQSIALPTVAANGNQPLTASGLSRSEGLISRSADGKYLAVTGYAAPVNATGPAVTGVTNPSIAASAPTSTGRTVALVDGNGIVDSSTLLTSATSPKVVRSAVTDGDRIWATGGNGGIAATSLGSTTATTVAGTAASNYNALTVQGDQLWSSGILTNRLAQVGTGTPSTASTLTDVPGLPTNLLTYGYALLNLTSADYAGTKLDTLYVANSSERGGTVDKYRWNATTGTWESAGYKDVDGATGLVASQAGTGVSLAVTTPTALLSLTDTNGSASSGFAPADPTTLATAPTGTEFRGVALAPTAPAATDGPSTFVRSPGTGSAYTLGTTIPVSAYVDGAAAVTGVTLTFGSQTVNATQSGKVWSGSFSTSGLSAGPATVTVKATTASGTRTITRTISLVSPPPVVVPTPPTTPPATTPAPTAPAGAIPAGTVSGADSRITHQGSWKGGTAKKKNSTAKATVFGKGLTLTFATGPKAGKVKVVVDGRAQTINLYATKAGKTAKTFSLGTTVGSHTFAVTVLGKKTKKSKGTTVTLTSVQVTS